MADETKPPAISGADLFGGSITPDDQALIQAFPGPDMVAQATNIARSTFQPRQVQYQTAATFDPARNPGAPFLVGYWSARIGARNARLQQQMAQNAAAMNPDKLLQTIGMLEQSNASILRSINQLERTRMETERLMSSEKQKTLRQANRSLAKLDQAELEAKESWRRKKAELDAGLLKAVMKGRDEKAQAAAFVNKDAVQAQSNIAGIVAQYNRGQLDGERFIAALKKDVERVLIGDSTPETGMNLRSRAAQLWIYDELARQGAKKELVELWATDTMGGVENVPAYRAEYEGDWTKEYERTQSAIDQEGVGTEEYEKKAENIKANRDDAVAAITDAVQQFGVDEFRAQYKQEYGRDVTPQELEELGIDLSKEPSPSLDSLPADGAARSYAKIAQNQAVIDELLGLYRATWNSGQKSQASGAVPTQASPYRNLYFGPSHIVVDPRASALTKQLAAVPEAQRMRIIKAIVESDGDLEVAKQKLSGLTPEEYEQDRQDQKFLIDAGSSTQLRQPSEDESTVEELTAKAEIYDLTQAIADASAKGEDTSDLSRRLDAAQKNLDSLSAPAPAPDPVVEAAPAPAPDPVVEPAPSPTDVGVTLKAPPSSLPLSPTPAETPTGGTPTGGPLADDTDPMFTEKDQADWREAEAAEEARMEAQARAAEQGKYGPDFVTPQPDPVAGTDGVPDDTDKVLAGSFRVPPATPTYKAAASPSTPDATLEYIDLGEDRIAAARAAFDEADRAVKALAPMARDNMPAYRYSVEQRTKALDYLKSLEQQNFGSPRISQPDPPLGPQSEYLVTREGRTQEMVRNWYNLSPDEKKKQSGRYFKTIVGLTSEFKNDPWVARNDDVFQQFARDVAAASLAATNQTTDLGSQ